jgi:hypothetical protein
MHRQDGPALPPRLCATLSPGIPKARSHVRFPHDLARIIHDADARFREVSNIHSIVITEDLERGRRPKTTGSRRVVPVHPN